MLSRLFAIVIFSLSIFVCASYNGYSSSHFPDIQITISANNNGNDNWNSNSFASNYRTIGRGMPIFSSNTQNTDQLLINQNSPYKLFTGLYSNNCRQNDQVAFKGDNQKQFFDLLRRTNENSKRNQQMYVCYRVNKPQTDKIEVPANSYYGLNSVSEGPQTKEYRKEYPKEGNYNYNDGIMTQAQQNRRYNIITTNQPIQTIQPVQQPIQTIQPVQQPIQTIQPVQQPIQTIQPVQQPIQTIQPVQQPIQTIQPVQQPIQTIQPVQQPIQTIQPVQQPIQTIQPVQQPIQTIQPVQQPIQTIQPVQQPIQTIQPVQQPIQTIQPVQQPIQTIQPVQQPIQTIQPVQQPIQTIQPVQQPIQTIQPVQQPIQTIQPVQQPIQTIQPVQQPIQTIQPVQQPIQTIQPVQQPIQTIQPVQQPIQTIQPVQQPIQTIQPVQQPIQTIQPVQQPIQTIQPVQQPIQTIQPVQQPIQTIQPVQTILNIQSRTDSSTILNLSQSLNCLAWNASVCIKCSFRFVLQQNQCQPVNPLCATFDFTGACLTCYPGYQICESGCIIGCSSAEPYYPDPNCNSYYRNGTCLTCSNSYYFNIQGLCTQVNPNCKSNDNAGHCLSCYVGYSLTNGNCSLTSQNLPQSQIYCQKYNNGVCVACASDAYLNSQTGNCQAISPLCKTSNQNNGNCLSCYAGYNISNGQCVLGKNIVYTDSLCRLWVNGKCQECSKRTYFVNGICTQVDPLCNTFDSRQGFCLSCFKGYYLNNSRCILNITTIDFASSNALCRKWNDTVCIQCAIRSVNLNGICTSVNPLCNSYNSQGDCLTCFNGYRLDTSKCILAPINTTVMNLCAVFNGVTCLKCAQRAYFKNGVCSPVNNNCNTFDSTTGLCISCYNGFQLSSGDCIVIKLFQPINRPDGNIYCRSVDSEGRCTQCFYGFALKNGDCVQDFGRYCQTCKKNN